jgi:hypothetical protein
VTAVVRVGGQALTVERYGPVASAASAACAGSDAETFFLSFFLRELGFIDAVASGISVLLFDNIVVDADK